MVIGVKVVLARGAITGVPVADAHPAKVAAKRPYRALGFMLKRVLIDGARIEINGFGQRSKNQGN
jgi:hypothetical protein